MRHACYYGILLAEGHLNCKLLGDQRRLERMRAKHQPNPF